MGINRRKVEQAVADTVFDNVSDQEKAAMYLKTYTFTFNPTKDFKKQLEVYIKKMRKISKTLFVNCD